MISLCSHALDLPNHCNLAENAYHPSAFATQTEKHGSQDSQQSAVLRHVLNVRWLGPMTIENTQKCEQQRLTNAVSGLSVLQEGWLPLLCCCRETPKLAVLEDDISRYCLHLLSTPMGLAASWLHACCGNNLGHLVICNCTYCYPVDAVMDVH